MYDDVTYMQKCLLRPVWLYLLASFFEKNNANLLQALPTLFQ